MNKAILGMMLVEMLATLTETCQNRTSCIGCPYYKDQQCTVVSTRKVLVIAGDVFREYLIGEGYYPADDQTISRLIEKCRPSRCMVGTFRVKSEVIASQASSSVEKRDKK